MKRMIINSLQGYTICITLLVTSILFLSIGNRYDYFIINATHYLGINVESGILRVICIKDARTYYQERCLHTGELAYERLIHSERDGHDNNDKHWVFLEKANLLACFHWFNDTILLYDCRTGLAVQTLQDHRNNAPRLRYAGSYGISISGHILYVRVDTNDYECIRAWDIHTGELRTVIDIGHDGKIDYSAKALLPPVHGIFVNEDNTILTCDTSSGKTIIYDIVNRAVIDIHDRRTISNYGISNFDIVLLPSYYRGSLEVSCYRIIGEQISRYDSLITTYNNHNTVYILNTTNKFYTTVQLNKNYLSNSDAFFRSLLESMRIISFPSTTITVRYRDIISHDVIKSVIFPFQSSSPIQLAVHSFGDYIIVADDHNMMTCYHVDSSRVYYTRCTVYMLSAVALFRIIMKMTCYFCTKSKLHRAEKLEL